MENEKIAELLIKANEEISYITSELKEVNDNISIYDKNNFIDLNCDLSGLKTELDRFNNNINTQ